MNEVCLDELSAGRFAELERSKFHVVVGPGSGLDLELMSVNQPRSAASGCGPAAGPEHECFSLLFDGPADQPLTQGTYRFSQERLGWFDLFIVPVGAERNARQYEAVFNRRVGPRGSRPK